MPSGKSFHFDSGFGSRTFLANVLDKSYTVGLALLECCPETTVLWRSPDERPQGRRGLSVGLLFLAYGWPQLPDMSLLDLPARCPDECDIPSKPADQKSN